MNGERIALIPRFISNSSAAVVACGRDAHQHRLIFEVGQAVPTRRQRLLFDITRVRKCSMTSRQVISFTAA